MTEPHASGFGYLLRKFRVGSGLTQEELAEAARLSPRTVSDLERGVNQRPQKGTAGRLAGALSLTGPVRELFLAAARGRVPAKEVLAAAGSECSPEITYSDQPPGTPQQPSPFGNVSLSKASIVGRNSELSLLSRALSDAQAGHGRFILLSGEPGIGKTCLAHCLEDEARRLGLPTWWGRACEEDGAPGFWPLIQIGREVLRDIEPERLRRVIGRDVTLVGQLLPEIYGQTAESEQTLICEAADARFRLFDVFTRLLAEAAADTGALVVLDDLHAADQPSLHLLQFLAGAVAKTRLLILCTYRDVGAGDVCLSRLLANVAREPGSQRHHLRGLSLSEVGQLIEVVTGNQVAVAVSTAVYRRTAGNPFFTSELVRLMHSEGHLGDSAAAAACPVPATVADVVRCRVNTLSEMSQQMLATACVIGCDVDPELVSAALQLPVEIVLQSLDETAAAGLSVAGALPGQHTFAHALVRDAVYDDLGVAERARLHQRVGTALEVAHRDDPGPHLAEIASHFLRAAPDQRPTALKYAVRAGEYEMSRFAFEQAVRLFTLALEQPVAPMQRWDLLVALADAQTKAGDINPALDTYLEAARLARSYASPDKLARAALGVAKVTHFIHARHDLRETISRLLEEALPSLAGNTVLRARVLATLAIASFFPPLDRWQEIQRTRDHLSRDALKLARDLGDDYMTAFTMHARSMALFGPDNLGERNSLAPQIIRHAQAAGDTELILEGLHWQFVNAAENGDLATMQHAIDSYDQVGYQLHQSLQQYWSKVLSTTLATLRGDHDRAERQIDEASCIGQQLEGLDATELQNGVGAQLFLLREQQGRTHELASAIEQFSKIYPEVPAWRIAIGQICIAEQDEHGAREALKAFSKDGFRGIPRDGVWLASLSGLAEISAFIDDTQTARLLYTLLEPYADRCAVITFGFGWVGPITHYMGILAATSRRYDLACTHLDTAGRTSERLGAHPWVARSKFENAHALFARGMPGDHHRAAAILAEAWTIASATGLALPDHSSRHCPCAARKLD